MYQERKSNDKSGTHFETPVPLRGEVHIGIHPRAINLVRSACHTSKDRFVAVKEGDAGLMRITVGSDHLDLTHPEEVPLHLRHPDAEGAFADWVRVGVDDQLQSLDGMALDIASLAVALFSRRTQGDDIDRRFPLLIDDCLDWRGVKPQKRSAKLRQQLHSRIQVLFGARVSVTETLHFPDPISGRRRKELVSVEGPYLVEAGEVYRQNPSHLAGRRKPDGYVVALGEWARDAARLQAMLGPYFKQLAEYDLRRQRWERQVGWYILTQLQNQGPHMTLEITAKVQQLKPQQPLTLSSILTGSHMPYQHMKTNDPGAVIRQVIETFKTLKEDGLIGNYTCLDGDLDGGDLPLKGRLTAMMKRRYLIEPGPEMRKQIVAKLEAKKLALRK